MSEPDKIELFDNPRPERDYCIKITCPEFTSVCPKTGQPDFGEIMIEYCPDESCLELRSLKFYLQSYRNQGIFYEALSSLVFRARGHQGDFFPESGHIGLSPID